MDSPVSGVQYFVLLAIAAYLVFYFERFMKWDLNNGIVVAGAVIATLFLFSFFVFLLQYTRARYLST